MVVIIRSESQTLLMRARQLYRWCWIQYARAYPYCPGISAAGNLWRAARGRPGIRKVYVLIRGSIFECTELAPCDECIETHVASRGWPHSILMRNRTGRSTGRQACCDRRSRRAATATPPPPHAASIDDDGAKIVAAAVVSVVAAAAAAVRSHGRRGYGSTDGRGRV